MRSLTTRLSGCFAGKRFTTHLNLRDSTPKFVRSDLDYYLAGLIEGDGSIYVPSQKRSVKGKKLYPCIEITFHLEDLPLALIIQQRLGSGSIHRKAKSNAYLLTINSLSGILKIIEFIHGKLRTPKINRFNELLDFVFPLRDFVKLPKDTSPMSENAWLAGFIEADGCFYLRITQNKPKISFGLALEQRIYDLKNNQNLKDVMEEISFFLSSKLKTLQRTRAERTNNSYRIVTQSERSNDILMRYLERFPLFSSKFLNYQDWKEGFLLIKKREGSIKQNIDKLLPIKEKMNMRRKDYVWDHLKDFYT